MWGLSTGSMCNYTIRCITTIKDALASLISWPTHEEIEMILQKIAKKGTPRCVGLIDGTTLFTTLTAANK
jgi:hypothetical protein